MTDPPSALPAPQARGRRLSSFPTVMVAACVILCRIFTRSRWLWSMMDSSVQVYRGSSQQGSQFLADVGAILAAPAMAITY